MTPLLWFTFHGFAVLHFFLQCIVFCILIGCGPLLVNLLHATSAVLNPLFLPTFCKTLIVRSYFDSFYNTGLISLQTREKSVKKFVPFLRKVQGFIALKRLFCLSVFLFRMILPQYVKNHYKAIYSSYQDICVHVTIPKFCCENFGLLFDIGPEKHVSMFCNKLSAVCEDFLYALL